MPLRNSTSTVYFANTLLPGYPLDHLLWATCRPLPTSRLDSLCCVTLPSLPQKDRQSSRRQVIIAVPAAWGAQRHWPTGLHDRFHPARLSVPPQHARGCYLHTMVPLASTCCASTLCSLSFGQLGSSSSPAPPPKKRRMFIRRRGGSVCIF